MWSCLLLADADSTPVVFSGVSLIPAGNPVALADAVDRTNSEHVLVVAPAALGHPLKLGVTIAAGRRPDLAITWMVSEHAPLAILSALAVAQATTEEPAIGVDLIRQLLAHSWSGAWTRSVAKLTEPNPRLTQHLRSLLPGAGFLIRHAPTPQVLGTPTPDDVPAVGLERVLLIQDGLVPASLTQWLSRASDVDVVRPVALPGVWTSLYGTDRTGQLALVPIEPRALISPITGRCPACELAQAGPVCPFCRNRNRALVSLNTEATRQPGQPLLLSADQGGFA